MQDRSAEGLAAAVKVANASIHGLCQSQQRLFQGDGIRTRGTKIIIMWQELLYNLFMGIHTLLKNIPERVQAENMAII